jgi:hypothetical protein
MSAECRFLPRLISNFKNGCDALFRNVGLLTDCTELYPRKKQHSWIFFRMVITGSLLYKGQKDKRTFELLRLSYFVAFTHFLHVPGKGYH